MPKYAKTKDSSGPASSKRIRYVPFARGFKFRDESACIRALGYGKTDEIPREFSCGPEPLMIKKSTFSTSSLGHSLSSFPQSLTSEQFFQPVPHPTSQDDWLAQYDEDGQTFPQFLQENPWLSERKVKFIKQSFHSQGKSLREKYPDSKICLLQLGKFDSPHLEFSDLVDYTGRFLCLPVEELPPLDLDMTTEGRVAVVDDPVHRCSGGRSTRIKRTELHCRHNAKTGRIQVRVDSVLSKLRMLIPPQALCLIALTTLDLYGDASDLFVAGMAAGLQRVAVFSLCRYDPTISFSTEHWFDVQPLPRHVEDLEICRLMIQRSCKLVVHEILHLLGVDHCVFYDCCMNGSGHLAEDFRQPMHLCPIDLRKLHILVGFDVCQRYRSLLQFYARHGLVDEARWVDRRLKYLEGAV